MCAPQAEENSTEGRTLLLYAKAVEKMVIGPPKSISPGLTLNTERLNPDLLDMDKK